MNTFTDERAVFNKQVVFDGVVKAPVGSKVIDFETAVRKYIDTKNKGQFARLGKKGDEPVESKYKFKDPSAWHIPTITTGSEPLESETKISESTAPDASKSTKTTKRG